MHNFFDHRKYKLIFQFYQLILLGGKDRKSLCNNCNYAEQGTSNVNV